MKLYMTKSGCMPFPLFIGNDGTVYDAHSIRIEMKSRGMNELKGKHIRLQLAELGLLEEFDKGSTPWQLPYSIWA